MSSYVGRENADDNDRDRDKYDDELTQDCWHCSGDGWVECRDPIQCTRPHNEYGECRCGSCGGSGRAEDMTSW